MCAAILLSLLLLYFFSGWMSVPDANTLRQQRHLSADKHNYTKSDDITVHQTLVGDL